MALKLKYTDEHGILHINMSPTSSAKDENRNEPVESKTEITDPKFDTINNRFAQYDLFGGKYDMEIGSGETSRSLFRSRYNSIEEELANTPYAFATDRTVRVNSANNNVVDIKIKSRGSDASPSKDIEDDRFFNRNLNLQYDGFGSDVDIVSKSSTKTSDEDSPAFTVTQLIHAQDRYFNLSSRQSSSVLDSPKFSVKTGKVRNLTNNLEVRSAPGSAKERTVKIVERVGSVKSGSKDEAFRVLSTETALRGVLEPAPLSAPAPAHAALPAVPLSKRKKETSFAIIAETAVSRPSSPRSLPSESRTGRVSPFKGRGFREETSRHTTPKTSAANSRASSPLRRRTNSLSRIDKMATATLPPPIHNLSRPHSPRNFVKENIEEVRELSELNREKHEAEAEQKRQDEEIALLKEMGLLDKNVSTEAIKSIVGSRSTSRSNSPSKIKLRSRSNSPAAILHFENIAAGSKEFINQDDGMAKPVAHTSRLRSVSKSQPQSNNGSPKHSKIPKRQSSVSPPRTTRREVSNSRKPVENNLNRNQRFISNSTSSIHETIKIGSQAHDKRALSKSTQHLSISPTLIKGKPPISPGRGGPPPSNRAINAKRLSPIVGTPNRSPIDDQKPSSAKTPTKPAPTTKKPVKTAGNTPATSRLNSRQPSRNISRDTSPEKRKTAAKNSTSSKINNKTNQKPVNRTPSTKIVQKPNAPSKVEPKKPINRTSSMKSLTRTPSTKTLNEKPPLLKKRDSKKDLKSQSTSKINELGTKKDITEKKDDKKILKNPEKGKDESKNDTVKAKDEVAEENKKQTANSSTESNEVTTQDNETQYDTLTNDKGELVILTKKNIVSMTTAAITAQPLEVVTTVTNQLPAAFEKAREKGIFERLSSRDSLAPKDEEKGTTETKTNTEEKEKNDEQKPAKPAKPEKSTILTDDNMKLKPLQPPYNNPQVERVKQKIDDILKAPEVSTENILSSPMPVPQVRENKNKFRNLATKTKNEIKEAKDDVATKLTDLKNQVVKQNEKVAADFRAEATKIVDSIITPVEEPKDIKEAKEETKKNIEPIVMVVNEKKNGPNKAEVAEKINETLVKGEPEVEVQSSNLSTPGAEKMAVQNKMADGNGSDKSAQSNGGFPQSTSTTPKPPTRSHRNKDGEDDKPTNENKEHETDQSEKKPNICQRIIGKCKTKCCSCCVKGEDDEKEIEDVEAPVEGKSGVLSKFRCCKKKNVEEQAKDAESAAGKVSTIEFESETKRKRKIRDVLCGCCGRRRRVSDVSDSDVRQHVAELSHDAASHVAGDTGCCGSKKREIERRDSILSDRPPNTCCNNRLCTWVLGSCRRPPPQDHSRRPSVFSKNKSLSPTAAPEDNRPKLDPSLVEHTSVMRGAIPILPISLAYFCLFCNVIVPGLGTIFSGMFCLCFGIPRFGVHDGAKHRIGSFVINLVVGCGQLFTVLFCLVGWGWSIWWGVIMVKVARKYRKLKAEAAAAEEEAAPPITANNHSRA